MRNNSIRLVLEYIFIMNLFRDIKIDIIFIYLVKLKKTFFTMKGIEKKLLKYQSRL
jgi:hypothetical protein